MATINIANLTFTHKGDYDGSTAYVKNDVVYYSTNGNAYIAKQNTTGNVPTNATYWSQFAQGSGGIWNAGLSLGSAEQVVKVNSGGNALEFGTISSEMVRLGSTTFNSGTPSSVNLDVTFDDSTYYKYELHGFFTKDGSTGPGPRVRVRQAGSTMTSSTYDYILNYVYRNLASNSSANSYGVQEDADHGRIFDWSFHGEDYPIFFKITSMAEMQNTTKHKTFQTECTGYRHSGDDYIITPNVGFFGYEGNTNAITGMNFYSDTGNFKTGHLVWYGFKR